MFWKLRRLAARVDGARGESSDGTSRRLVGGTMTDLPSPGVFDDATLQLVRSGIAGKLGPGEPMREPVRLSNQRANIVLKSVIRFVADLPPDSTPLVVWTQGRNELVVHTNQVTMECTSGLVTMSIVVDCDQIDKPERISVPLAVGTPKVPAGLVMSTYSELLGSATVTAVWSDALTAFAWEALLETARAVAAAVGRDGAGRPLVPGAIAAGSKHLLIHPMARHGGSGG